MIGGLFNPPNFLVNPTIQGTVLAGTGLTLPAVTLGGTVTATGQEIDAAILDACVGKGTWTASGTWTIPAVTLGGNVTINGKTFDAGAGEALIQTSAYFKGLRVESTSTTHGVWLTLYGSKASPGAGYQPAGIVFLGKDNGGNETSYGTFRTVINASTEGSEDCSFIWVLFNSGAENDAMTLTGAGVLSVDLGGSGSAAQVDLFDDYDDALVLRQGIQQNNRELLADMGILERKDSGSGYMMKIQPMVRLLAGGIYQTRQMLEETKDELMERLDKVERKLLEASNGKAS